MALDKDIIGSIEFLKVTGLQGSTYLLKGPNGEDVKLNQSEVTEEDDFEIGEEYIFFIYPNRSGELFATQNMPDVTKDKYDFAKVIKTDRDGAHIDVGLPREILVPWEDLPKLKQLWPEAGDYLLVTLRIDSNNQIFGRLASETIVEKMYTPVQDDSKQNEHINARAYRLLRVGSFLLSDEGYKIFVHESERKEEPRLGEEIEVRIIGHNEKGELNGSFLPLAHERLDDDGQVIFDLLIEYNGELPFWDKSSPDAIKEVFNMSKGSFKRAIGHLYKEKIINIEIGKITLTKKGWSRVKD
ncbi:RNA-binding virulence regulatory protein CvfB [Staphylococcus saccharolyticus]|uniref:RNA-binding virulence regulatory protein CvfB n=1 Tax=Staphylococcus saccharolyticus TaxID=33028 RepID=UPI00102DFBFE|nr:RNA-binding virulence regulatory protein CvfB [Staphylococcus saccharolyticus]MBL7573169.1 RNA-binding virulence regulatory protein CvfB [Staphylococcus saccharolyticus]MBL7583897.1 RNA-binding virulence regulatory protein CvfB [Staphylococcus saccharolyticus]MBL7638785.1 RNA-binding virulence regulatory protein CvfB [Staphylococcus saccharolyticus]QRJ67730.1 RNA-binding virulence regulatory protein CvfB [Staphylococcus saccharolyticus]TAA93694.1 RNA-binding protein [Staphylococcus saccharo